MKHLSITTAIRGAGTRSGLLLVAFLFLVGYFAAIWPAHVAAAACAVPATSYGTATSTINVENAGTYRIWSRIMAPDATANSYLLEVDGNTCYTVGDSAIPTDTWTWIDYQSGAATSKVQQNLTAGNHTIKMIGREPGVKLDRVLFVSDLSCAPTGLGDNCVTAGDTEVPSIAINTPTAQTSLNGTVAVNAGASDNVAVSKVEFYVNGALKSTDTASPYSYDWNTASIPNGSVSLMAKAYDAAGNSSSDTIQVTVANGDTQAPSVPGKVTAQANAYNKVTVAWNASTDNIGVAGYWVSRNGVVLGQVLSGTQYIDQTVLPNTAYSYRITAVDAAGNTSAPSNEAKVTTPNTPDSQAPGPPSGIRAQAVSSSQINISWNASTDNIGVAGYDIFRSVNGQSATRVATVTGLSFGNTGLAANTSYTYYVVAKDRAGNVSQKSATVTAKTQAKPPAKNTGTIKGKVKLDPRWAKTATVTITVKGAKRIASTDRQGNYAFYDVPAGLYILHYRADGHYSKVALVKVKSQKTQTKNVTLRKR